MHLRRGHVNQGFYFIFLLPNCILKKLIWLKNGKNTWSFSSENFELKKILDEITKFGLKT